MMNLHAMESGNHSALFLDRDGVINHRLIGQYVTAWNQFEFLPGVTEAIAILKNYYRRIFIVTNQQGIGKGLMTDEDLETIHRNMLEQIHAAGGQIDKVYYCPDLAGSGSLRRKPLPGMALEAATDFPDIDLKKSVMVGDTESDIAFGEKAGMQTVLITPQTIEMEKLTVKPLRVEKDLLSFALLIKEDNETI